MEKYSLCGKWNFAAANGSDVDAKKGTSYYAEVPGSWKDIPELREYCGIGCYSRSFELDSGQLSKRVVLHFGGVFRSAKVILNGVVVGSHSGFQSPFRIDITGAIIKGENLLEVYVDSRRADDELFGSSSVFELIPLDFDGIYEPVTLEISSQISLYGLYTPIDSERQKAIFIFDTHSEFPADTVATIRLRTMREGTSVYNAEFSATILPGDGQVSVELPLEAFELWSPEHPVLYNIEAELIADGITDTFRTRTGFKRFETIGHEFYLNGNPYYLLGYGDDFVYPNGMPSATESSFYFHGINRAKEYGFNFVRHHSHFPFEPYLDAADEMGLLVQPELALANVPREMLNEKNSAIFLSEWRALIKAYRHHPCIAAWCGGNEMEWGYLFSRAIYDEAKRLDPYRPVESTDGNFMACDVDDTFDFAGIVPGEYTDYLPYRELTGMFLRDDCGKPQVVHEMGNYTTVCAIDDLPKFSRTKVGCARTAELDEIVRKRGCQELYRKAFTNSLSLQKLCHKLNIEKARLSPYFCGYHVWTLTDYYETTQGILNSFYEDKAFTAEEFAQINRECVLLWDTPSFVFPAGETAEFDIKLSKYGSDMAVSGVLTLMISDFGSYSEEKDFTGHGIIDAAKWSVRLPDSETEREYKLNARFEYDSGIICNSWSLFAVPQVKISGKKEIYIHYLSRHLIEGDRIAARHFTIPQPIGKDQLIITDYLYGGMPEAVENGAAMLLFARPDTFKNTVSGNSFKTPWWNPGEIWYLNHTNNLQVSCVIENHPATEMLPYNSAWKLDMFGAVEQAVAVGIDVPGFDVEPIIYGVDTKLDRLAYLFEFALGRGKILVCTLNHSRVDIGDPAVEYLLKSLINYALSDKFNPVKRLSEEQFEAALNKRI